MEPFVSPLPPDSLYIMPAPIQNFFFLVFYSNPQKEKVYVYPDGDEHRHVMSHDSFIDLIIAVSGYSLLPYIHEAISSYGTFWIYDRENSIINRIAMKGSDDLKTIQGQIQKALRRETTPLQNPINPAENLAYTPMDVTLPQGRNPFERKSVSDEDDAAPPLSVTIRK